jgi:hypothetical protein
MAISDPYDLLATLNGHSTVFELLWRQEQSRQANGRTIVKDLGHPLWTASYQSVPMYADEIDAWRARLDAMENGMRTFYGRSISRLRPINHPGMSALPAGTLASIAGNRKEIGISGLSGITLTVGDMVQIGTKDLHRIVNVASGLFEVRPHIWPGVDVGAAVSISKPHCIMSIVPGSVESAATELWGLGAISFQAVEAR